ncbi:MAG: hypothetical protein WA160_02505 [Pseudobdellovibrio sp.]
MISFSAFAATPYRAYIDNIEDDDQPITVFKTAGQNWKYCTRSKDNKDCADAIGWPNRDSKITVLGESFKAKTKDPITNETVIEEYTQIEFEYDRVSKVTGETLHQTGIGYVETSYLSKKKTSGFYKAVNANPKVICPPGKDAQAKIKSDTQPFKDLTASIENLTLEKKAEILAKTVGFCPLKPPTKMPSKFTAGVNVYDEKILPTLKSAPLPKIKNENNKDISRDELIQIDSLARTLYGEMALCFRRGLQYPMAVARVIMNRAENKSRASEFIKPPHVADAPDLTKVCTTPSQFSMWLKKIDGVPNQTLHHGLCPPIEKGAPFWNSNQAPGYEYDIWKNTMRIATEAILYPIKFKKRTSEINGYHYTSGMGKFFKMKQVIPSIEGKALDRSSCLEIWK